MLNVICQNGKKLALSPALEKQKDRYTFAYQSFKSTIAPQQAIILTTMNLGVFYHGFIKKQRFKRFTVAR